MFQAIDLVWKAPGWTKPQSCRHVRCCCATATATNTPTNSVPVYLKKMMFVFTAEATGLFSHGQDPARKDYALKAVAVPGALGAVSHRVRFRTVRGLGCPKLLGNACVHVNVMRGVTCHEFMYLRTCLKGC